MDAPSEDSPKENNFIYRSDLYRGYVEFLIEIKRDGEIDFEIALYRKLPKWVKKPRLKKPKRQSTLFPK